MKYLIFSMCCFFVMIQVNAQQPFRYDTIRTGTPQTPVYGTPQFSYDTIRSTSPSMSTPTRTRNTTTMNNKTGRSSDRQVQSSSSFDKNKLFFGGSLGMQFGDYTLIDVSPQIGYAFNQYVALGLGLSYTYQKGDTYDFDYTRSYAGINIFGQFYPISNLVLSIQPEANYLWGKDKYYNGAEYSDSKFVPVLLVGGGVRIPTGRVGGVIMMVQYDVIQNDYSPYGDKVFYTVGYAFGF